MGLSSAASVRAGLIEAGRDPQTPAAVLARGTRPDAKAVVGRLDELPALAAAVGEGPALLVIGDVVAHSEPWRAAASPADRGGRMTAPSQQKLKVHGPVVVTANRLSDGAVVYRGVLGVWTTQLEAAEVVTNADDAKKLLAAATAQDLEAVGPYVAPVEINGGQSRPVICANESVSPGRPSTCRPCLEFDPGSQAHVRLRRFRPHSGRRARHRVPRPGGSPAFRRTDRGRVQAVAADERRLPSASRLYAADRDPLRHAVVGAASYARAHRAPL